MQTETREPVLDLHDMTAIMASVVTHVANEHNDLGLIHAPCGQPIIIFTDGYLGVSYIRAAHEHQKTCPAIPRREP